MRSLFAQVEDATPALRRRLDELLDRDWQLAIALALSVGVLVWFGRSIKDFFSPAVAGVLVPALVGQTETDALNESASLKLKGIVVERQPSDKFPKDVVMGRNSRPLALARSRRAAAFADREPRRQHFCDAGFAQRRLCAQAQLDLSRLHLQLDRTSVVANDDLPANSVVTQDPLPLASVREGTAVTLQLSKGPPNSSPRAEFHVELAAAR